MRINDQQQFELEQTINSKINDSHALIWNFRNVIAYINHKHIPGLDQSESLAIIYHHRERRQPPPLLLSVNHG